MTAKTQAQFTITDLSDGTNIYTWTMYADDASGTGISTSSTGKMWRGVAYNKSTATPSTNPADYTWSFITDGWVKTGTVKIDGGKIYADKLSAISADLGNVTAGTISGVTLSGTTLKLTGMLTFPTVSTEDMTSGMTGRYSISEDYAAYNSKILDGKWNITSSFIGFTAKVTDQKDQVTYYGTSYFGATMVKLRAYANSSNNAYDGTFSGLNNRVDISPGKLTMGNTASVTDPDWTDNIEIIASGIIYAKTSITSDGKIQSGNIYLNGANSLVNDTGTMYVNGALDVHIVAGAGYKVLIDSAIVCAYSITATGKIQSGNVYFNAANSIINDSNTIYVSGGGGTLGVSATQVFSPNIYNYTFSGGSAVFVSTGGVIGRSSSARKYKILEEPISDDLPEKILNLVPKTWFDKNASEQYADLLTKEMSGEEINPEDELVPYLERVPGLIAEDLVDAGLTQYVLYSDPDENGNRSVEGIMYDRLYSLLIPITRNMKSQIDDLQQQINILKGAS